MSLSTVQETHGEKIETLILSWVAVRDVIVACVFNLALISSCIIIQIRRTGAESACHEVPALDMPVRALLGSPRRWSASRKPAPHLPHLQGSQRQCAITPDQIRVGRTRRRIDRRVNT